MALCTARTICLCTTRKWFPCIMSRFYHNSPLGVESNDVMDEFTSNLMQRKSAKWEERKTIIQNKHSGIVTIEARQQQQPSIEDLEIGAVNALFQQAIDCDDYSGIINLTKQCTEYQKIPQLAVLLSALSVCSRFGDKDTIVRISQLCEQIHPELLEGNSNFDHYIAEAIWVKGDIKNGLKLFERVYKENSYVRCRIRCTLKHLILNSVADHSEAVLVILLQFSEMLVKEHKDYFTLGCLWQACILSDWFTDQELALSLLEKHHKGLYKIIANKIQLIIQVSLRKHNTEIVYRLNEVLLKLEMESEVCQVILLLIDYWIQQGDFRQCKEIVLWSLQNDISLPMVYQNKKLVELLANNIKGLEGKCDKETSTVPTAYKF